MDVVMAGYLTTMAILGVIGIVGFVIQLIFCFKKEKNSNKVYSSVYNHFFVAICPGSLQ